MSLNEYSENDRSDLNFDMQESIRDGSNFKFQFKKQNTLFMSQNERKLISDSENSASKKMQSNISVVCNEKPFSDENTTVFSGMTEKTKKQ